MLPVPRLSGPGCAIAAAAACLLGACRTVPDQGSQATSGPMSVAAAGMSDAGECAFPTSPDTLLHDGGAVLLVWRFPAAEVLFSHLLPNDSAFRTYRAAVIRERADVRRPVVRQPDPTSESEARLWRDEAFNNRLVFEEGLGEVRPVTCLEALLFSEQAARVPQLERPTEFLASVLRRESAEGVELAVIFGAGADMFPPKSVYGFDVVDRYLSDGWTYWYFLHNHTVQRNGESLALGTPAPSTSDVGLMRSLARDRGLLFVGVTNGFYTFVAAAEELEQMRER